MSEGITLEYKSQVFTIEKYTCDFFEKDYKEFIKDIEKTIDILNKDDFCSVISYYIFIAKLTKSVVNCCDITNPVFSYVGC